MVDHTSLGLSPVPGKSCDYPCFTTPIHMILRRMRVREENEMSKISDAHVNLILLIITIPPPPQRRPGQDPYSHTLRLSFCRMNHSYMLCT